MTMTREDFVRDGWRWCRVCRRWFWFPRKGPHLQCGQEDTEHGPQ